MVKRRLTLHKGCKPAKSVGVVFMWHTLPKAEILVQFDRCKTQRTTFPFAKTLGAESAQEVRRGKMCPRALYSCCCGCAIYGGCACA